MGFPLINNTWSLFLDRDGVINVERPHDYVKRWEEFVFYDDALPAIRYFSKVFGHLFIITNQRGIGRGLMTEADLQDIHLHMREAIEAVSGRIDGIYYCPDPEDTSSRRKPATAMGLEAAGDFPEVDLRRSVMIGNTLSDMEFGRKLGMFTIFLQTTLPDTPLPHPLIDAAFKNLSEVVNALQWSKLP